MALCTACATSRPALRERAAQPVATAPTPNPEEPAKRRSTVKIKGIHGTLNDSDVHQAMEGRQREFNQCIAHSRKSLRLVSGTIRFAFKVAADGHIAELRCTESTIGHRKLEQCLTAVVGETHFPNPAGGATARFNWNMMVEPASGRPAETLDPDVLKPVLRRHALALFRTCRVDRARERFRITAYVTKAGRVLSAGAVASPARADKKLDCVLEEFAGWRIPKLPRYGKLTFNLR